MYRINSMQLKGCTGEMATQNEKQERAKTFYRMERSDHTLNVIANYFTNICTTVQEKPEAATWKSVVDLSQGQFQTVMKGNTDVKRTRV